MIVFTTSVIILLPFHNVSYHRRSKLVLMSVDLLSELSDATSEPFKPSLSFVS